MDWQKKPSQSNGGFLSISWESLSQVRDETISPAFALRQLSIRTIISLKRVLLKSPRPTTASPDPGWSQKGTMEPKRARSLVPHNAPPLPRKPLTPPANPPPAVLALNTALPIHEKHLSRGFTSNLTSGTIPRSRRDHRSLAPNLCTNGFWGCILPMGCALEARLH